MNIFLTKILAKYFYIQPFSPKNTQNIFFPLRLTGFTHPITTTKFFINYKRSQAYLHSH